MVNVRVGGADTRHMAMLDLTGPDVLVVDDQADIREVLRLALKREGLTSELDGDSAHALRRVAEATPRCVVLDVMMPGLDGFTFLDSLHRDPQLRGIPVIFLSGNRRERDYVRGLELGAVDYVSKPFDPVDLAKRVREVIEMSPDERRECRDARLQQALVLQQVEEAFTRRR